LTEKRRELELIKNLAKIENFQTQNDLLIQKSKQTCIKNNTRCPVCHKNIGFFFFFLW
jgi:plasmid rolling circle replication initiator protein Rep